MNGHRGRILAADRGTGVARPFAIGATSWSMTPTTRVSLMFLVADTMNPPNGVNAVQSKPRCMDAFLSSESFMEKKGNVDDSKHWHNRFLSRNPVNW